MAFTCPICKTASIVPGELDNGLATKQCSTCGGHWITAERYFQYVASASPALDASIRDAPPDSPVVKMCPECRRFMRYYPVGHGLAFGIDKCNTCGGIWLNKGEWESLKSHNFHTQLHAVSSDTWQNEVQHQIQSQREATAMAKRLGDADFAELERIAHWVREHPHGVEMLAYLEREGTTSARKPVLSTPLQRSR